ncbi:unnamed protein product [Merluccius merluccius]
MRSVVAMLWALALLVGLKQSSSTAIISIDLSSKNLSVVPGDLPSSAEYVDLSLNHIRLLRSGDFENTTRLRFLNLSWNGLEKIDQLVFSGTPLLEDMDLSHNSLQNLSHQPYLFNMRNLQGLNLAFNMFFNMRLGEEFRTLATLQRLAIGGNNIQLDDFKSITGVKLQTLTLCLEIGTTYVAGSLDHVRAKRLQIVLSKGKILGTLYGLLGDALLLFHELELTGLTGGYNNIVKQLIKGEIHTSHFHLTDILIQWHDLTDFVNAVLQANIPQLTITDMALLKLPFNDTYVSNTSAVKSITLRRATVKSFFFSQTAVYNFFINMPVVSMAVLETPIIHMTCPMSQSPLRQLDFSNCAMADTIFSRVEGEHILECETFGQLNQLFLRGNNLKDFQVLSTRVQYMTSLEYLDLSLNYLIHDSQAECAWPPSLIHVNLSSNRLTHSVFSCLPRGTKVLDLQNNQVSVVPQGPFLRLDSLAILDLSSNRLRDLPVCGGFPTLTTLLLNDNSLHAPSVTNLNSCPKLEFLDVSHNPYTCTCELRSFRSLGTKSQQKNGQTRIHLLSWPVGYRCSYPDALRNSTLKDFWIPEVSCNVGLLAVTILGPAFIIIIAVTTICHRLDVPWYMSMIWQWAMVKYRAKSNNDRLQDMLGVEFHAFVSYSQQDAEWVNDTLLPNLQGPAGGGLHICHHGESFLPGKTILENIMHCVEKSWRCVFVLSSHFVKSDWCNYELYFASQQHLSWGSDRVVLLLLEPVPQYLIPSKFHQLKLLMSKHTYLEWPQEKAKHRLFWANLRAALQEDLRNAPPARQLDVDDVTTSTPSCQRSTATAY